MPYFSVEDFKAGLDVRRSKFTSVAGTLQKLVNAHITRGGDIEKRKAFVDVGGLPEGTFGLADDLDGLVTFGSIAQPSGMASNVRYMQLTPPSDATMLGIAAVTLFGGYAYVAADFDDGKQWHFYKGELVGDWNAGIVLPGATLQSIASELGALIDADPSFTATIEDGTITVVGPIGYDYAVDSATKNVDGGADDFVLLDNESGAPKQASPQAGAAAEFSIISGSVEAGGSVDQVACKMGGVSVDLLLDPVPFTTVLDTSLAVAYQITERQQVHGFTASSSYGKVYVYAPRSDGSGKNGAELIVSSSGSVVMYEGSFAVTGGTEVNEVNLITSIRANGKNIVGMQREWVGSNAETAEVLAAAIRATASVPKYNATAEGGTVFFSPAVISSSDPVEISWSASSSGDVTLSAGGPSVVSQIPGYTPIYGGGGCVDVHSVVMVMVDGLPVYRRAADVVVGDVMIGADPVTLEPMTHEVTYSVAKLQPCVMVETVDGSALACSVSAPLAAIDGLVLAPDVVGRYLATLDSLRCSAWYGASAARPIGDRLVQHLSMNDGCFWAGLSGFGFILHHNKQQTVRIEP